MRKHNIGRISLIILLLNVIFIAIYLVSANIPETVYKVTMQGAVADDEDEQEVSGTGDENVWMEQTGREEEAQ